MDVDPHSIMNVIEGNDYNLSCMAANAKPHAAVNWYIQGRKFDNGIKRWTEMNANRTVTVFAMLTWKPQCVLIEKKFCNFSHISNISHFSFFFFFTGEVISERFSPVKLCILQLLVSSE